MFRKSQPAGLGRKAGSNPPNFSSVGVIVAWELGNAIHSLQTHVWPRFNTPPAMDIRSLRSSDIPAVQLANLTNLPENCTHNSETSCLNIPLTSLSRFVEVLSLPCTILASALIRRSRHLILTVQPQDRRLRPRENRRGQSPDRTHYLAVGHAHTSTPRAGREADAAEHTRHEGVLQCQGCEPACTM